MRIQQRTHGQRRSPEPCRALVPSRATLRLLSGVVALLGATRAAADDTVSEAVHVSYAASVGCPGQDLFLREVSERTSKLRLAAPDEPGRRFAVSISGSAAQASGELLIVGVDGTSTRRGVGRGSCDEVVSALALITALAIDPDAASNETSTTNAGANAAPNAPSSAEAPAAAAPPPAVAPPRAPVLPPFVAPPAAPVDAPRTGAGLRWEVGASADALVGIVPSPAFGGGVFAAASPRAAGGWRPNGRASLLAFAASPTFERGVGADLLWAMARLEACVTRALVDELALGACAAFDAGVLHSRGTGVDHRDFGTHGWFAPGVLGRVEWAPGGRVVFTATGGVTVPLHGYPFTYVDASGANFTPFSMPTSAGLAEVAVGYRFR